MHISLPLPGTHLPSLGTLLGSAQGQAHALPTRMCCVHTQESTHFVGTNRCAHSLPRPTRPPPISRHVHLQVAPGPGAFSDCAVSLPAAAQRADIGGEAGGTPINHSQMLLQRLQELLRQGNASDVVLRVQAAGTDEVRVFHTHRLLLGLHSELFRELLRNQSEVVLQEPRDCAAVFDKFIRWGGAGLGWGAGHFLPSQAPGSSTHRVTEPRAP